MGKAIGRWHPAFWKKRAKEHKERVMANELMYVGSEPSIARVAMVEVKWIGGASNKNYWRRNTLRSAIESMRKRLPGRPPVVKVERRMWAVYVGNDVTNLWERHVMAAADLEALQFHYAKHLMAKDTEAAGYV